MSQLLGPIVCLLLAMAGTAEAAPGDSHSVRVYRTSGPSRGGHIVHDIAFDGQGRVWFTSLERVLPNGSHAAGRIGRFTPGVAGSLRLFDNANMRRPHQIIRHGAAMYASDPTAHVIFRVAGGVAQPIFLFDIAPAVRAPNDLLSRGQFIWFLARDNAAGPTARVVRIGRFNPANPAGTVQSWTVPQLRDGQGLAMGPDGNLWFVADGDDADNGIGWGRIDPDAAAPGQTIDVFPRANSGPHFVSNPRRLVRGPDNMLWFIDNGTSQVGRIDPFAANPALTAELFGVPCDGQGIPPPSGICGGLLYDLVVGPDDALWYTRSAADALGRVTVGGDVSSQTPPGPFDQPLGIAHRANDTRLFVAVGALYRIVWYEPL